MHRLEQLERSNLRSDLPSFKVGDTIRVHFQVVEGGRTRSQLFQGTVIRKQGKLATETFTVRKISFGIGVEKTFPLNSPKITKIKLISSGKVRRAKLYYLRQKVGKQTRIKEKRSVKEPEVAKKE